MKLFLLLVFCLLSSVVVCGDVWRATPEEISRTPAWMVSHAQRPVDANEVVVADVPLDMKLFLLVGQSNMAGRDGFVRTAGRVRGVSSGLGGGTVSLRGFRGTYRIGARQGDEQVESEACLQSDGATVELRMK